MNPQLVLSGIDGSNPLAFLAALGTLRTLTRAWKDRDVKLSWFVQGGMWAPTLHSDHVLDQSQLLNALDATLEKDATTHSIAFLKCLYKATPESVRQLFRDRASVVGAEDREDLDMLSAMSSELATEATSQLQTVRRDYFWGNLESVMRHTTVNHLRRALFQSWDYADPLDNQSLHIEPSEDRRHAYQWSKPSGDPDRKRRGGMLGANRLAIEAFPLFQSIVAGDKLITRGFTGTRTDNTRWTWPLWSCPINLDVAASLLALSELQAEAPDAQQLRSRGISVLYRCRRILVEKTPNFTPAQPA
ncbi:MAG: hypothetical protein GXY55_02405 [Phycisphaerae bacterium]|nr:hypothetical protein [Phycisphaerae bacterium]